MGLKGDLYISYLCPSIHIWGCGAEGEPPRARAAGSAALALSAAQRKASARGQACICNNIRYVENVPDVWYLHPSTFDVLAKGKLLKRINVFLNLIWYTTKTPSLQASEASNDTNCPIEIRSIVDPDAFRPSVRAKDRSDACYLSGRSTGERQRVGHHTPNTFYQTSTV